MQFTARFFILLVKNMLCSQLHYQTPFKLKVFSYKIGLFFFFFFFFTLVKGLRRCLILKLRDTRVYDPGTRARLGTTARFCKVVVRESTLNHSQICLVVTQPAFSDLRKTNHRYCPTLLVSLDYDTGFPRRTCEDSDPVATSLYQPTPAPETRNPNIETRNAKGEIRNPKPESETQKPNIENRTTHPKPRGSVCVKRTRTLSTLGGVPPATQVLP